MCPCDGRQVWLDDQDDGIVEAPHADDAFDQEGTPLKAVRKPVAQALACEQQRQAATQLQKRQQRCARRVIVKAQGLIYRQFKGGGLRAAAERQYGGKA